MTKTSQYITRHLLHSRHVLAFHHCSMHRITTPLTRARSSARGSWQQRGRRRWRLPTSLLWLAEPGNIFVDTHFKPSFLEFSAVLCTEVEQHLLGPSLPRHRPAL